MSSSRPRRVSPINHDPDALRWARERSGWSQADLARAAGVSRSLICEIENGSRGLPPRLRNKLAEVLNCPVSVLEAKRSAA
jgi:transcriptional regulator with XRE-family HTH domain